MFRLGLAAAMCLLIVGCATDGDTMSTAKATSKPTPLYDDDAREMLVTSTNSDVVCRKKRRTGSHFLFMVCKSKKQEDLEGEQTREALRDRQMNARRGAVRLTPRSEIQLPSLDGG